MKKTKNVLFNIWKGMGIRVANICFCIFSIFNTPYYKGVLEYLIGNGGTYELKNQKFVSDPVSIYYNDTTGFFILDILFL